MRVKRKRKNKVRRFLFITIFMILMVFSLASIKIVLDYSNLEHNPNSDAKTDASLGSPDGSLKLPSNDELPLPTPTATPSQPSLNRLEEYKLTWDLSDGKDLLEDFRREYDISFPNGDEYSAVKGITTFRGNNYRNTASYGFADVVEKKLEKAWSVNIGHIDSWTGVGWTGQASIIQWDPDVRQIMNIVQSKKSKDNLKEVIYATLDGKIYFLDLDDGKATRSPIDVGYPIKGSVSVDPRGYPLLYSGQGIPEKEGKPGPIGYRIFSLIDQKLLHFIDGMDSYAYRKWGAFDSSGLIDRKTDTLIECGENGVVYTLKLNTRFVPDKASISINPQLVKYRYRSKISDKLGIENSPAIYKNYIFFVDNSGLLQCLDLNTMEPVWALDVTDDTDSSIAIEEGSSTVSLYTACEVDSQGKNGISYIRKINALTGEILWEREIACANEFDSSGGALASPIIGKYDIEGLVIYNLARTGDNRGSSKLIALDKKTGETIWTKNYDFYSWSSPVDVYTRDGKSYIVFCASGGYMYLLEGMSGKELDKISLEANTEASPAVFENMVVVGTRGQKIWGIRIK